MMNIFSKFKKKQKDNELIILTPEERKAEKSIQDLIPIKDIYKNMLVTPWNSMVLGMNVSAHNLDLMSSFEVDDKLDEFESHLKSLNYVFQTKHVSMPIDMSLDITQHENKLAATTDEYKRSTLSGYIEYEKSLERDQTIIQRQRFFLVSYQMKEYTHTERRAAVWDLDEKGNRMLDMANELELDAVRMKPLEWARYLHTMFDYIGAQQRPIESLDIPEVITVKAEAN